MALIGLEKILEHIAAASESECEEITRNATQECERVRADYSRIEQDKYWKYIDAGTKEAKIHGEQLAAHAESVASNQIQATQQELIDEAFALAAKKLGELPDSEFSRLLSKLKLKPGSSAADVVAKFRNQLTPNLKTMLFD